MLLLIRALPSRLTGASRCSLPCTLISTLFADIATLTPTAPETSSWAPSRTRLRLPALTASCPPVARVSESPRNSTVPALPISMRDWSRRSLTSEIFCSVVTAGPRMASRWLSSAIVLPSSSTTMAVVAPRPRVTAASPPRALRCIVPRVAAVVDDSSTPSCRTSRPARVMSPSRAWIRPVLTTLPAVLAAANCGVTSLPRVVDSGLPSVPTPFLMVKPSPAASRAWPFGVLISPALWTSLPSSIT
ncbi:hypothetical protein D3C87_1097700 [compost metagenome]